jgi:hypothetical protein
MGILVTPGTSAPVQGRLRRSRKAHNPDASSQVLDYKAEAVLARTHDRGPGASEGCPVSLFAKYRPNSGGLAVHRKLRDKSAELSGIAL